MCSKGVLKQPWKVTHIIFSRIIQKDHSVQHTGRKFRCWSSLQCDRKTTFVLMNSWHGVGLLLKQKRKGPTQHEALDLDNRENKKCCRKHRDLNMTSYNIWPLTSYYWKYFWIFAPFEHFSTKRRKAGPIGPIRSTSPQRAMGGWRPPTRKQDDLHCDDPASQQLSW